MHPGSQRMDVDDLAYAMISQASSAKHLSDQWMQLSAHNQVMGTRYAEIVAQSLLQGQAMSNHNLLELARLKARDETEAHLAGVQWGRESDSQESLRRLEPIKARPRAVSPVEP